MKFGLSKDSLTIASLVLVSPLHCTFLQQEVFSLPPICAILAFISYPASAGDGLVFPSHVCHPCFYLVPCQSMRWTSRPPICAILAFILYPARAGDGLVSPSHVCHPCFRTGDGHVLSLPSVYRFLAFILHPARAGDGLVSLSLMYVILAFIVFLASSHVIIAGADGILVHPYDIVSEILHCLVFLSGCYCHEYGGYLTTS